MNQFCVLSGFCDAYHATSLFILLVLMSVEAKTQFFDADFYFFRFTCHVSALDLVLVGFLNRCFLKLSSEAIRILICSLCIRR